MEAAINVMTNCYLQNALLTLPMLRLPLSKAQGHNIFRKPSKHFHVGIHWKALAVCSQMGTHLPGFQSFSVFFNHFVLGKLATSSIRVNAYSKNCLSTSLIDIYSLFSSFKKTVETNFLCSALFSSYIRVAMQDPNLGFRLRRTHTPALYTVYIPC